MNRELDPDTLDPITETEVWSDYDRDYIYGDFRLSGETFVELTSYEAGVAKVINPLDGPLATYYHTDMLGTTRVMSDHAGNYVHPAVYTAFGELVSGDPRRFGYAGAHGYQTDTSPDMPFFHIGHREYDPSSGRFLQRDPMGISGSQNAYEYVWSNPVTGVDPNGLRTDMGLDKPPGGYPGPRPRPQPPKTPERELKDIRKTLNYTAAGFTICAGLTFWCPPVSGTFVVAAGAAWAGGTSCE